MTSRLTVRPSRPWPLPLGLGLPLLLAACGGAGDETSPTPAPACADLDLSAQPQARFPLGQTYWLPSAGDPACADPGWTVTDAPAGSQAAPVHGADGYSRFTPDKEGSYTLNAGTRSFSLVVTSAVDQPFHHLNYYATQSMAEVGDEVWTADVYRPTLTRIDPATLQVLGTIPVGPWPVAVAWRPGMAEAVVAQRGADTLGIVDVASGTLIDAVWVGDEPTNVVLDDAGTLAYVALTTEAAVAVVDLAARAVVGRIDTVVDPLAMALDPAGERLYVASHRSGMPNRYPYEDTAVADERDLDVIDTASLSVVSSWLDIGTVLTRLTFNNDGSVLYLARRLNDTEADLADPEAPTFVHEVAAFDPATGDLLAHADLSRQDSSGGYAVTTQGLAVGAGAVWVTAEGSDLTLELDPTTLAERSRHATPGRPRQVITTSNGIFTHGAQGFVVTRLDAAGASGASADTGPDPRPEVVAAGQAYFTGAGRDYGQNWACNSCHLDGLTDTLVWNAGPFEDRVVSRPLFWLEGAWPLGWAGYLANVRNYAYTVNTNVGIRPTTEEAVALWEYLASLMPPPAANGWTERDGGLSAQALRGKALYDGKAACASCHALPLTTTRTVLGEGITAGTSDTPVLVGAYRHGAWLKTGEAGTYRDGVRRAATWLGVSLSDAEVDDLTRYVSELTARDFFVLETEPHAGATDVPWDAPLVVTLSHPVWEDAANLAAIRVEDADGEAVVATLTLADDGRHITVTPSSPLTPGASYTLVVGASLTSLAERPLFAESRTPFTTAAAPSLRVEGDYVWTVFMPSVDFANGGFDPSSTLPTAVGLTVVGTASGGVATVDFGQDLVMEERLVVSGGRIRSGAVPVPIGPSFADSTGFQGDFEDADGDGIGDTAEGTLTISGPGFVETNVAWSLARPLAEGECAEGSFGTPTVVIDRDGEGRAVLSWEGPNSIGVYVTDPDAVLPTGPKGVVTNGDAFWVLEAETFPTGFAGPVTYGVLPAGAVDASERHGAPEGGASLEEGGCYKFSVTSNQFTVGYTVVKW